MKHLKRMSKDSKIAEAYCRTTIELSLKGLKELFPDICTECLHALFAKIVIDLGKEVYGLTEEGEHVTRQ